MNSNIKRLREIVDEFPNHERQVKAIFSEEEVSLRAYEVMVRFMRYHRATLTFITQIAGLLEALDEAVEEASEKDTE